MALTKSHNIKYENEAAARSALIELCIYVCFLIVTLIVATSSRSSSMYFFNAGIAKIFLVREMHTPAHAANLRFMDLATTWDMWTFLEEKFLSDLHNVHNSVYADIHNDADDSVNNSIHDKALKVPTAPNNAAKKKEPLNRRKKRAADDKLMFMGQNVLLGPPRLRQIRVRNGTCDVHDVFGRYFATCYADSTIGNEDTSQEYKGSYYKKLSELGAYWLWADIDSYSSGGFVKNLTYNYEENRKILSELKKSNWLDRASRVILVQFTLFNPNNLLVNNIKLIGEMPSTGGLFPWVSIQSVKLGSIFRHDGYFIMCIGIIFYLFIIYYLIVEIGEIKSLGFSNYDRLFWNCVDLLIISLAFLTLLYNIWHPIYVNTLYKRFDSRPDEYLELDPLCFWNVCYRNTMGMCAFWVCIKIFKFINCNKAMRQFSATVNTCFRDLLGFSVMFGIVFLAYAQLGLLLFGNELLEFRNFLESLLTMIRMIFGDFNYVNLEDSNRIMGPLYFLTYILLVFFILLNMFLAIINDTYTAVKSELRGGRNYLLIYLRRLLHTYCPKCCRIKPPQDEEVGAAAKQTQPPPPPARRDDTLDFGGPAVEQPPDAARVSWGDDVLDLGEPTRTQYADTAAVSRLTSRIAALEDVIEQLVADVDRTMRRVAPRRRRRPIRRDASTSEG